MKPIFLFPHIPKTGGAPLLQNVERYFPIGKCLRCNATQRQFYYHPRSGELCFYEKGEDLEALLLSLTPEERGTIQFASGHALPYGIHRYFPQQAHYFLFVRHPIARTLSLYNYQRFQRDRLKNMKEMDESHKRLALFSDAKFLIEGKIPTFEEWLERSYNQEYDFYFTMTRFLQNLGYTDRDSKVGSASVGFASDFSPSLRILPLAMPLAPVKKSEEPPRHNPTFESRSVYLSDWDSFFSKFFFVGLTETIDADELYLYHLFGANRFWADRNRSAPYITYSQLGKKTQEMIWDKNRDDLELYRRAKIWNEEFKMRNGDFYQIVKKMAFKKKLSWFPEKGVPFLRAIRNRIS